MKRDPGVTRGKILEYIKNYINKNGYSPSIREVASHAGIVLSAAYYHLRNLEKANKIKTVYGQARSIREVKNE